MKRLILSLTALAALTSAADCQKPYWQDVSITSIGDDGPRAEFVVYPSEASAIGGSFTDSPSYSTLCGEWDFAYFDCYKDVPDGIERPDTEFAAWDKLAVPSNWELHGYGTAIYVNQPYEFSPRRPVPPYLPEANPVGVYRRTLTVPEGWDGRRILLNVAGAKSGVYVYLNGNEVGYSEDSKDLVQYDVTRFLREGENTLVLKIFRWSTGSYLECQDFWRISGIERDIYLSATDNKCSLDDFSVRAYLNPDNRSGSFGLTMRATHKAPKGTVVGYVLYDAAGRKVASESRDNVFETRFTADLAAVEAWSAENPYLYTLVMNVGGDYVPFCIGFRRFEMAETEATDAKGRPYNVFLVNGQPVKFKGVNVHEHTSTGHYITEQQLRHDLELMRQNNINAIRTCHYPQGRRFYELCDEYGIYVWAEANIESHGMGYDLSRGGTLGNNPAWRQKHIDRIVNMYERCKNYPSITMWSLGNEAGNGVNFYDCYTLLKELDDSARPVCYERAGWEWNTDMYVPQYPDAEFFEYYGKNGSKMPVIPSEYAHAMGNSTGSITLQWSHIYRYPNLQGAFIWDWIDQGFDAVDADGRPYWTYGGDYGKNAPSDANFLCNGILFPDRTPHPAMDEIKYAYSNIAFFCSDDGAYSVVNRNYFTDLADVDIRYEFTLDGRTAKKGTLKVNAAPQSSAALAIPKLKVTADADCLLTLTAVQKSAERGIPAGHIVAREQFEICRAVKKAYAAKTSQPLTLAENDAEIRVSNAAVDFVFSKERNIVTSYRVGGKELLADGFGLRPNYWRAPTDNDYGNGEPDRCEEWRKAGKESKAFVKVQKAGDNVEVTALYFLPFDAGHIITYTIYPNGILNVANHYKAAQQHSPELPRLGVRLRLPLDCEALSYYGRGPKENYRDRKAGSTVALYSTTASAEYVPYVRPQECGHHCDVRFIDFGSFTITADNLMEFNALRNAIEDLDAAEAADYADYQWRNFYEGDQGTQGGRRQTHINDAARLRRDFVELCLDYSQTGVGGYDSWGSRPENDATLWSDADYDWEFSIVPASVMKADRASKFSY